MEAHACGDESQSESDLLAQWQQHGAALEERVQALSEEVDLLKSELESQSSAATRSMMELRAKQRALEQQAASARSEADALKTRLASVHADLRTMAYKEDAPPQLRSQLLKLAHHPLDFPVVRVERFSRYLSMHLFSYEQGPFDYSVMVSVENDDVSVLITRLGFAPPDRTTKLTFLHPSGTDHITVGPFPTWPASANRWGQSRAMTVHQFIKCVSQGFFAVAVH